MTALDLQLFGEFVVRFGGEPLRKFRTTKAQALLAFLVVEADRPHPREQIFDLLWPGLPEKSARTNLRQIVYQIRKALPQVTGHDGTTEVPLILSNHSHIRLNADAQITSDVASFEQALAAVRKHEHSDLATCAVCLDALTIASSLYRGQFLDNLTVADSNTFEDWLMVRREMFQRRWLDALKQIGRIRLDNGRYDLAEDVARRQLTVDNLRESAHRQLLEALARSGRRSEALAHYDRLKRLLQTELGMAPSRKTARLAQAIVDEDLDMVAVQTIPVRGYELLEPIGSGAFGTVHRAYQSQVGREVAIKLIKPEYANKPAFIRRFEYEAQTVAALEHPYIVPLYDYWREPDRACLVMRYLRGGTLRQALESGTFSAENAPHLITQIADALAAAHQQGIIHRDVNPNNILLDERGNAYLSDFGIAHTANAAQMPVDGTPSSYLSPEQRRNEPVTPRTDVYGLGATLRETLLRQRSDDNRQLSAVVDKAMAQDPADRFDSVLALADAVLRALPINGEADIEPLPVLVHDNPYKGLQAFQEGDAQTFFGRRQLTDQLASHLADNRFLAVVGPSGSGKSSLVKAGLIPALRSGAIAGSADWFITEMLPGTHPLEELEAALLRVAVDPPASLLDPLQRDERGLVRVLKRALPTDDGGEPAQLLLVIDQFEELFTLVADAGQRNQFIDLLLAALASHRPQLRVVLTLRADFYDRPLQVPQLAELLQANTQVVVPLNSAELEQAIAQPARLAGVRFAPTLTNRIIDDVRGQASILPLLQYALRELFERRDGDTIPVSAYDDIGGVTGAIGRQAEEIYSGFDADSQPLVRQLFLRFVTLGEGVEDTRRRVLQSEMSNLGYSIADFGEEPTEIRNLTSEIVNRYGAARLLSFDRDPATREPTVEVAHEALLREWPRLRKWLNESRADVRMQRVLGAASADWQRAERDPAYLLRGSRLEQFEGWASTNTVALTPTETDFLNASTAARDAQEAEAEARRQRALLQAQQLAETERARAEQAALRASEQEQAANRLRQRALLLAGAVAVAAVLAVAAFLFGQSATTNANLAATREVEAQNNAQVAQANADLAATSEAEAEAQAELAQENADLAATREAEALAAQQAAQEEADIRATAEAVAVVERENAEEQTRLTRSRELALASLNVLEEDAEASLLLALEAMEVTYTKEAEEALHKAMLTPRVAYRLRGQGNFFRSFEYSPDGSKLAAVAGRDGEDGPVGTLFVWDATTGQELFVTDGLGTEAVTLEFTPDGEAIVVGIEASGTNELIKFVDSTSGQVVRSLAVFPLENLSGESGQAGQALPVVSHVSFSPDGTRLLITQYDSMKTFTTVWDSETGTALFELPGVRNDNVHPRSLNAFKRDEDPNFSPDGKFIAGGTLFDAFLWDASTGSVVMTTTQATEQDSRIAVVDTAFSADGNSWISKGENGVLKQWDIETGNLIREYDTDSLFGGFDLSRDGNWLVTSTDTGNPIILSVDLREERLELPVGGADIGNVGAFGLNDTQVATRGDDGIVVWDITAPREVATFEQEHTFGGAAIAFHPSGRLLASGAAEGHIKIWDVQTGEQLHKLQSSGTWITHAAFSPDGKHLLTVGFNEGEIWDVASGELVMTLDGHEDGMFQTTYSPDGNLIATSGYDGTARVWDSATGELLLTLPFDGWYVVAVTFSPDSTKLALTFQRSSGLPPMIFDIASGEQVQTLDRLEDGELFYMHYTADGARMISGSYASGNVFVWDTATGQEVTRVDTGRVTRASVLLSDNRTMVIGTTDGTVEVWDIQTGERLRTLFDGEGNRQIVTVSPDERYVASIGFQDGVVRVFTLDVDELQTLARDRLTRTFKPAECAQYRIESCPAIDEQ